MRMRLNYVTPLLVSVAAGVAIATAPAAMADAASTQPAGILLAPTLGGDPGGNNAGPFCGAYCGSYRLYRSDVYRDVRGGWPRTPAATNDAAPPSS
jgi:hypothetical protein